MGNAGRVLMIPKGDYNAATTYEMLDCVYYNGRSYVCKQTSTGNVPTNTTYWQALTGDSSAEIQALTNYVTENNVKNILPNGATSQTINGITYTVNSDGSITANGTASGTSDLFVTTRSVTLKKGSYILSGGVDGGENNAYKLQVADTNLDNIAQVFNSTPLPFTLEADTVCQVRIRVYSGKTINGTFKPMITEASITDPTYEPYAKTNVELTQDKIDLASLQTVVAASSDFADFKTRIAAL